MKIGHSALTAVLVSGVLLITGSVAARTATRLPSGARYVAMGSSFAAGSGIAPPADTPANRCGRSAGNYAHQLARKRGLQLVDVSCGGATTAHLLGPWGELPAQVDALTEDTALVTITIGGNNVGYIGRLIAESCRAAGSSAGAPSLCGAFPRGAAASKALPAATEETWRALERNLTEVAAQVRRRSPHARLIFVDYGSVLPKTGLCDAIPLSQDAAVAARATARRLADLTARVAHETGAESVRASRLSRRHGACAADPWTTGFMSPSGTKDHMPYHPNRRGMTMLAKVLDQRLSR
jgi:lysophospholipase L1-like esterase